jgi:hypothetical protein
VCVRVHVRVRAHGDQVQYSYHMQSVPFTQFSYLAIFLTNDPSHKSANLYCAGLLCLLMLFHHGTADRGTGVVPQCTQVLLQGVRSCGEEQQATHMPTLPPAH